MNEPYKNWQKIRYEDEEKWRNWIATEGNIFLRIGFPPTALLDRHHFNAYIGSGSDLYDYEPFELDNLTNKEAWDVLVAVSTYVVEPFMSWVVRELYERFHLPFEYGENLPPIPSVSPCLEDLSHDD
jgi:hypothetical protein